MRSDEELEQLRSDNRILYAALVPREDELEQAHQANEVLRAGLKEAIASIGTLQEQLTSLQAVIDAQQERIKTLERQQAKDSHNSSLPPSSDRFVRPAKSLRHKSGKKTGGQPGHRGHHLSQVEIPDEVLLHRVDFCEQCQRDRRLLPADVPERRQVLDLPSKRLWVREHQVEEKQCPRCFHLTRASFPIEVKARAQ